MRLVLLASLLALMAASSCPALADGCYFSKFGGSEIVEDLTEPDQKAVIVHHNGKERLILQVSYKGSASEFAWLVPTPSRPKLASADLSVFDSLHRATASRIRYWLNADKATRFSLYPGAGAAGAHLGATPSVQLLERRSVAGYDVSVLRATRADDLLDWLHKNGYRVPDKAAPILAEYISKGWVFSAARIDTTKLTGTGSRAVEGFLKPLQLDFVAPEPVYPLKISSINPGSTNVLLYVLADHFVTGSPLRTICAIGADSRDEWGYRAMNVRRREELLMVDMGWQESPTPNFCITKLSADLDSSQMTDDILLTTTTSQAPMPPPYVSPPLLKNVGALAMAVVYVPCVMLVELLFENPLVEPLMDDWVPPVLLLVYVFLAIALWRRPRPRRVMTTIGAVVFLPLLVLLAFPRDIAQYYEPIGAITLVALPSVAALLIRRAKIRRKRATANR